MVSFNVNILSTSMHACMHARTHTHIYTQMFCQFTQTVLDTQDTAIMPLQTDIIVPEYRNVEKVHTVISYFLATFSFSILSCSSSLIFHFFSNNIYGIKLQLQLYTYPNVGSKHTSITLHLSIHDSVLKISTH